MYRLRIFVVFLLSITANCYAQFNHFEYLTSKDGLSNHSIFAFYEDEYSRMWVATRNGLNCYDGGSFRVWGIHNGLQDTYIRNVVGDKKGNMLIQTRTIIFHMDLKTEHISPIWQADNIVTISGNEDGLWIVCADTLFSVECKDSVIIRPIMTADGITTILAQDSLRIWVASTEGVRLYEDGHSSTLFFHFQHVTKLYEDSRHHLWVCTQDSGLYQCSHNQELAHYVHDSENPSSLTDNDVRCVTEDMTGAFWIGLYGGLCRLDQRTGTIQQYNYDSHAEHALSTISIWALTTDRQGTIWIGTYFGGIDLINPQYSPYTYIGSFGRDGYRLSNSIVNCTCADENGNLWIGTNGGGINFLNRNTNHIDFYSLQADDPQYPVKSIWLDVDNGHLWVGTHRDGLKWLDVRTPQLPAHTISLPEKAIRHIMPIGDSIGVLTQHSIYIVSRSTGQYRPLVPPDIMPATKGELSDMAILDGMVWFARANSLYAYPYGKSDAHKVEHYELPANVLALFADSQNGLLIGTDNNGVMQKKGDSFIPLTVVNDILKSPCIMDIKAGEDLYIYATDNGLYLSDRDIQHCRPLSYSDKFPIEAIVEHSCAVIGSEVCVGGVNGMILYSLEEKIKSFTPVSLHLCHLQAGNQFIPSPLAENGITLQPSDNILSFVITAAGFITRNDYRVRFRLRGYEKNWTETRNNAQCSYSNLPSGNYTLEVECVDTDLKQSFSVRVLPHWYASWWAWLGYSLISIGLLIWGFISFIRYIERRAKRKLSEAYQQELLKATNIVMNHLADSEFNIERFAREMLVSRTKLFEKIQQISGQTPNEFILGIRMREAANMLRTKPELSILDVSIVVGFNSCSYFTKCFHHHFGVSPTAWRKSGK